MIESEAILLAKGACGSLGSQIHTCRNFMNTKHDHRKTRPRAGFFKQRHQWSHSKLEVYHMRACNFDKLTGNHSRYLSRLIK